MITKRKRPGCRQKRKLKRHVDVVANQEVQVVQVVEQADSRDAGQPADLVVAQVDVDREDRASLRFEVV